LPPSEETLETDDRLAPICRYRTSAFRTKKVLVLRSACRGKTAVVRLANRRCTGSPPASSETAPKKKPEPQKGSGSQEETPIGVSSFAEGSLADGIGRAISSDQI
jgi:hypothetical protein